MNIQEDKKFKIKIFFVFGSMIVLFFGGSIFYHEVEKWRWIDSFYFSATTMTTVGYGDLSPKTDTGKIFSIFYLFTSVGIAIYGLSLFASHFFEIREEKWIEQIKETKKKTKKLQDNVKKIFSLDRAKK